MRLPYGIDNNLLEFGNAEGVAEIVERFYNEGCRRFALYGDPTANPAASQERIKGFFAGMKKCRLKVRKDLVCPPVADEKKFLAFLDVFEDPARRPDAVCCINDYSAGLLIKEFEKRKIDISGIQFSGFDYSPLVRFIPKSILTVKAPVAELGKTAAETLIRQVENPHFGFRKSKLKVKVVKTLQ
jgi:LacI family transcriptional regulator